MRNKSSKHNGGVIAARNEGQDALEQQNVTGTFFSRQVTHTGPLPPPEDLRGYDDVKAGFAERIMQMAEKQQDAEIELNRMIVRGANRRGMLGMIFGVTIGLGALGAVVYLVFQGKEWPAVTLGIAVAAILGFAPRIAAAVNKSGQTPN